MSFQCSFEMRYERGLVHVLDEYNDIENTITVFIKKNIFFNY